MKSGYLYVLEHPSDSNLVKIGHTTRNPKEALAQHNSDYTKLTGQIVKETGRKWRLKECVSVPDPAYAKAVFWETTSLHAFRGKEDVSRMQQDEVRMCLDVAKKAGTRPPPKPRTSPVRNREWMIKQLEGTGITMTGHYRGLVTGVEFQCTKGHVFKRSAGVVAYGKSCPLCDLEKEDNGSV
jgi:hypothetical protein